MGNKNQPQVVGALRRLTFTQRHGKHVGQEGVKGQAGGSAPGFTHAEGGATGGKIGTTFDTWTKQPFDESLANSYADAIADKFGSTPPDKLTRATWIAPDGRTVGVGGNHEDTSEHALAVVDGVEVDDFTITETQVIQAGLIRHTFFPFGQDTFIISGIFTLTGEQRQTIRSLINARVDERASVKIPSGRDNELVGLRLFVVEDIPPSIDPISRELGRVNAANVIRLLGLNKNEWRTSDVDTGLVVSTAPRLSQLGELITQKFSMPDFEIDIDEISYDWVSGLKDAGIHTVPIEPKDGIIAMPRARVEPKEEEVEKKSLLAEVRRSLGGLMEALAGQYSGVAQQAGVARHGQHIGQEGREGEKGGSAPGFTHGEGGQEGIKDEFGRESGEWAVIEGAEMVMGEGTTIVELDEYDPENEEWTIEYISSFRREDKGTAYSIDLEDVPDDLLDTWTSMDPVALEDRARSIFGLTDSIEEAGWLLDNGDMLDFSGKREGGQAGMRSLDHRDINRALINDEGPETDSATDAMVYFAQETRAMRVSYFGPFDDGNTAIDIYRKPTQAQWNVVRDMVSLSTYFAADINDTKTGNVIWSIQEDDDFDLALRKLRAQAAMKLRSMSVLTMTFRIPVRGEKSEDDKDQSDESVP